MKVFRTDQFRMPLPDGHRFPVTKYAALAAAADSDSRGRFDLAVPRAATESELCLAHAASYVERVLDGALGAAEVRALGLPWSPQLVERARRSVGATIAAQTSALSDGVAVNLAGGTHHAGRDTPAGYCLFNDVAVAALIAVRQYGLARVLIVDADVHQGNGTAEIMAAHPEVFTFSIHGARNYPYRKVASDLDIALPDGCEDAPYLAELERGLRLSFIGARPQLVLYLAGADPYAGDRLGRLALTMRGLAQRDQLVMDYCRQHGVPVAVTMAGGYAPAIDDVVRIHLQTINIAYSRYRAVAAAARSVG